MDIQRRAVTVRGRVQGVGFRYFTCDTARNYGLTGWVCNAPDGSVVMEAQGAAGTLDAFIADVNEGPPLSRVNDLQVVEVPPEKGETGFDIRY